MARRHHSLHLSSLAKRLYTVQREYKSNNLFTRHGGRATAHKRLTHALI